MTEHEVVGLVHPAIDAHTLGISTFAGLLDEFGLEAAIAPLEVCRAVEDLASSGSRDVLAAWVRRRGITALGFSYRLDPGDGFRLFSSLIACLDNLELRREAGGPLRGIYFAGLPETCERVRARYGCGIETFDGTETPEEVMRRIGVSAADRGAPVCPALEYDRMRISFAEDLVRTGKHLEVSPVDHSGSRNFGARNEHLLDRLDYHRRRRLPPLMRAHVGPYLEDRGESVRLFLRWCEDLGRAGLLDVLSIGTSQLSQSEFGRDWRGMKDGGGVPLNRPEEFEAVWEASRPMLTRTYAGSRDVSEMARLHERTINTAWHALSLWWFCALDGRGPNALPENLASHLAAMRYIASTGKPFEPNVPHHFAFRGTDDVSFIVSGVLAARAARRQGIRHLVLQIMLNTPRSTWGVQDLAKARALTSLVRELEDGGFRVILQPRAGLDYFVPDLDRARVQLAAVTALMDDIEPGNDASPDIIHVVGFSEAVRLADPAVINESIALTRASLSEYRRLRGQGRIPDMKGDAEVLRRTEDLREKSRAMLKAIEAVIPDPYSARGLLQIFQSGFLPVPYLWLCRDDYPEAVNWQTKIIRGGVEVVRQDGSSLPLEERLVRCRDTARRLTERQGAVQCER